ncbi:adenylyltransferase and sulfurtransferase MOCS3-like isoform X2 [Varroa jacobsoni]|uniref:Adenylyltransferase and sulfurtransferase MOCS3 homolog n=1 Tax=Varroa destructor TaxID=109461 RepID=A0A7M7JG59_VARDE|nr:adenylyltransferase and sulfurtransferase MOCS3-like isoform X2 [Varroa destructor]XP_022651337.1 adenylyltransferase and sulfurtransferase MOCS3-like isoform X3 [Varroa destructor]XP_022708877.1 adenylyltransferase and sulfurtransferase MOCS3-like isoform X1 [Varroa jacobsoni]XP_022708878.1 adenylyltransferase and sulfurtransferase MOCS3-like isoform X2 [Varroa jacobsoni]XP_022708879.1 adenylyltransferase and sulfurtransferase MOCS3-like isoform X2 [Varroa jacobsoni]
MERLRASQALSDESISRYSRQLLLPQIGPKGMRRLADTRVLLVGAGGLGCPAAMYLASSGIGCIGIVEYDTVDLSNLHRQIGHKETSVGKSKTNSLIESLKSLNSSVKYLAFETALNRCNAMDIAKNFDIIVDATDNVSTRYLLNDLCVLQNKPLVSGSALRWDGQLTVYHYNGGPCYRCVFPRPPPPETVTNCADGGVLGPITGIIGSAQALEVIKIILNEREGVASGKLLLLDGLAGSFRNIRLRSRDLNCAVCGDHPTIKELVNYETFCGVTASDKTSSLKLLPNDDRYTPEEFRNRLLSDAATRVVDIRPKTEFDLCHIPDSINVPFDNFDKDKINSEFSDGTVIICRRGNDSQRCVQVLRRQGISTKDVKGGLAAWAMLEGVSFPTY